MKNAQIIIDATQEIFSSMIMLEVTPGEPFERNNQTLQESISGIVGLAGTIKGLLAIHMPNPVALSVTTAFLGMEVEEIDEDVSDAIGELANMLAGSIKAVLDPKGSGINLSMPSAVFGEEYTIDCLMDAENVTVPFQVDGQNFSVELQIREEN